MIRKHKHTLAVCVVFILNTLCFNISSSNRKICWYWNNILWLV